eukprot:CAMPEP_0113503178 /NCGR_PEP_ID=MMETSP0014_2-20120614/34003_1 /TAXON_ID=2857 /ORGANISM="Nitzschia sp." /LENGTH=661 /DNA_ID=CAMNT_0000398123 /DNA_START=620 /DNA_END=2605 /DNA_ORIENTATION=+ /assembly_acc=CAM_ASM_000159
MNTQSTPLSPHDERTTSIDGDIIVSPSSTSSSKKKKKMFSLFGGGSNKSSTAKKGPRGQSSKPGQQKEVADGPTPIAAMAEAEVVVASGAGGGRVGGRRRSKLLPPNIPNLIRETSSMSIGSGSEGSRCMSMSSNPSVAVSSSSPGGWSSSFTSRGSTQRSGGSSSTATSNTMSTAASIMSNRGPAIASSESQHKKIQAELGLQESDLLYILKETIPKFYEKQQQVELHLEQSSNSNSYGDYDFDDTAVGCGSSQGTGGFFTSTMEFHINDKEMEREMVLERSQWHAMNIAMNRGRRQASGSTGSGRHHYGANSNIVRPEHWPRDELDDLENILQTFLDATMMPTPLARADSGGSYSNNGSNHTSTDVTFSDDTSLTPLALAQVHTTLGLLRQATGGPERSIDNLRKALWIHQRSTVTVPAPGTAGNSNTTAAVAAADPSQSQRLLEIGKACHRLAMSYARMIRPMTMMRAPPLRKDQSSIPGIVVSSSSIPSPSSSSPTFHRQKMQNNSFGRTPAAMSSTSSGNDHGRAATEVDSGRHQQQHQQHPDTARSSCKSLLQAAIGNYESAGLTLRQSSTLLVVACATLQHYVDEERRELERLGAERVSRMESIVSARQTWSSLPSLPILPIDEQNSHGSSSQSGPLFAGPSSTASHSTGTERR